MKPRVQILPSTYYYRLSQPHFLYLTTRGWKTGRLHKIEIWFVELGGRYYIVSECMERSHWVQNISHEAKVLFTVGEKEFQGTARIVAADQESSLAKRISAQMDAKYGWSQGLVVELAPS